jgi:hypothetical protein
MSANDESSIDVGASSESCPRDEDLTTGNDKPLDGVSTGSQLLRP